MPADDLDNGVVSRIASAVYSLALTIVFVPLGFLFGARGVPLLLFVLACIVAVAFTISRITVRVPEAMAEWLLRFVFPSGYSTPYEPTYSHLQATAARGDLQSAVAGYREAIRLRPMDPVPRFQLAELLLNDAKPAKAAWYLGQARRLSADNPDRELYATQRMIDLYLGPLDDPIRAKMELKHLIDRFPGSREANSARAVLRELQSA